MAYHFEDLKDKVCVITGGGGVIGTSLATGLASVGAKIVILDLYQDRANEIASNIAKATGTEAIGVESNVLDKGLLLKAREEIIEKFGRIDILINGAGGNSPKATTELEFIDESVIMAELDKTFFGLEEEAFKNVFDLNFMGTLLPSMVFAREMVERKSGVILNISSMNSFRPLTKIPAYSAAKASINNFTEWLAVHFAKAGVRVNGIAPGFFITNQNRFLLIEENTGDLTPRGNKIISNTPMGKFGEPDDLIGTVLYLLSDLSAFITGVTIPVDGGFNAYSGV
jgi:NAD(P)-dependent dehydrogenase (short-subunit alcohol dehydrogenase family)